MLGVDPDSKGERLVLEVHIVAGEPTAEEVAAVTAVLLMRSGTVEPVEETRPVSRWRLSGRPTAPGRPGPGAWRASALP
jgi:hypothetical protein